MNRQEFEAMIPTVLSSYVKRWMEKNYDRLMRTDPAVKLMSQGKATRYAIEASLYSLWAYIDQKWPAQNAFEKFAKTVVGDAPSEMGKRLVNGFREEVLAAKKLTDGSEPSKAVTDTILSLDDATLHTLLCWVAETPSDKRETVMESIRHLSPETLSKLVGLSSADREIAMTILTPEPRKKDRSSFLASEIKAAHERSDATLKNSRKQEQNDVA